MKREKIELTQERKIITNMITSTDFLKSVAPLIIPRSFEAEYANIVSRWIIEYFERFNAAPERNIQDIYQSKKDNLNDLDTADNIDSFLYSISKDYSKPTNIDYSIHQAEDYLKLRNLQNFKENLGKAINKGSHTKAENIIANYKRIEKNNGEIVDILEDSKEVSRAYMNDDEVLFSFTGALGKVLGNFYRGDLIAFLAFSNKGKTWWQMEIARLANVHGFNALVLSLEQTKNQIVRRGWQLKTGQTLEEKKFQFPKFVKVSDGKYEIEHETRYTNKFDSRKVKKTQKKLKFSTRKGSFRVEALPSFNATFEDIVARLDNLQYYDNYIPDVLVVDYADIIKPSERGEYRHQLDNIWKKLRGLAQQRNILVVTATQSGRAGAKRDVEEDDIAEDIRKLNHVSLLIGLNQSKEDYAMNLMKVSQLKKRNEKRDFRKVGVLYSFDVGMPHIDSRFLSEIQL